MKWRSISDSRGSSELKWIFSPSFTLYCDDNPLLSDMKPRFKPDTKARDPSLTIADTLGLSPELGTLTLRSQADSASAVTTSAQVIQPVVSLQLSPTQHYWLNHHHLIRLLMDFNSSLYLNVSFRNG
jgi:hypothetical protein